MLRLLQWLVSWVGNAETSGIEDSFDPGRLGEFHGIGTLIDPNG